MKSLVDPRLSDTLDQASGTQLSAGLIAGMHGSVEEANAAPWSWPSCGGTEKGAQDPRTAGGTPVWPGHWQTPVEAGL